MATVDDKQQEERDLQVEAVVKQPEKVEQVPQPAQVEDERDERLAEEAEKDLPSEHVDEAPQVRAPGEAPVGEKLEADDADTDRGDVEDDVVLEFEDGDSREPAEVGEPWEAEDEEPEEARNDAAAEDVPAVPDEDIDLAVTEERDESAADGDEDVGNGGVDQERIADGPATHEPLSVEGQGQIEADPVDDLETMQPIDERLDAMDSLDVFDGVGDLAGGNFPGSDLGPVEGGGVPGEDFSLLDGGGVPGEDFDPFDGGGLPGMDPGSLGLEVDLPGGMEGFDPASMSGVDLQSTSLGSDVRTGYDGYSPNDSGDLGSRDDFGGPQSGGDNESTNSSPGAPRENPNEFGAPSESSNDEDDGSWTGITEFSDYSDSEGNQQIDSYEEYHQEDGTTLVIETHHDDENGTTQKVTLYDEDGNVIEQEETHEPAGSGKDDEGGSKENESASSGNEDDGSSDDAGNAEGGNESGDDDSRPNPYADDYRGDVDVSLTFSNEELTTPVEPGGDDLSFGAERLIAFGDGIVDPRTVNPNTDDNDPQSGGGGDGAGGTVGEGIVDPVEPGLMAGDLDFSSSLMSMNDRNDEGYIEQDNFDDFDPFIG